ncbi:MAG TPA: ATP-binding protein [Roseiflexaceae bacterium]|nr:ATP-binding protein [Roseiflexaceae bacterium]HMP40853.1 ATP-binding protein [Roseiflexaceae bacterium]
MKRRSLRFRIVAVQMLVVVVGVVTLIVTADLLAIEAVAPELLSTFRMAIAQALLIAALAATIVGLVASILLAREILRPLAELDRSSRRIADGHFDERIAIPSADELAVVAHSFNQMAEALEHVEEQRIVLIGNVAHELRTPLAGLEGYLEGLLDGVLPGDPATISAMQHEVRRLRRLVDDLQQLSRVEAGQVVLHPENLAIVPLVERVVTQLQPQLIGQRLTVLVEGNAAVLQLRADPDRTAQILVNLIGNALRYTPDDGRITVRIRPVAEYVEIAVEDTGVGIPAEALPYLFERFYRVDPSRSRSSGGSGIGLTIARHLAWAMGGEIRAASAGPGHGSTFTLTLPRAARPHRSPAR